MACRGRPGGCGDRISSCLRRHPCTQAAGAGVCPPRCTHARTHVHAYMCKYKSCGKITRWSMAKNTPTPAPPLPMQLYFPPEAPSRGSPPSLARTRQLLCLKASNSGSSMSLPGDPRRELPRWEKRAGEEPKLGENCVPLPPLKLVSWQSRGTGASFWQGGCFHRVPRPVYFFISLFTEVFGCAG